MFLSDGRRDVRLRANDRKNNSSHEFVLRERWLPTWFLQHYSEVVSPHLQAVSGLPTYDNRFLVLCPNSGKPYGCLEEDSRGEGRDDVLLSTRLNSLAELWQLHVAIAFKELNFLVPVGPYRFTMHIVRNVGGHAVFVKLGPVAAAHFLGDRVGSVEGVYAKLKGEYVDTSLLDVDG